jgi:excisionase family DNA binding protein
MSEQLLRPADVAEILQVSKALAYKILKDGYIPTVRFGKTVRVRREDLDKYIYENVGQSAKEETGNDAEDLKTKA